ncbi:transcription initiation factor TFIIB [Halolamina salifodinae]|uniref:Transcription initiation factor IIB n=1 Tax=Halolamina salifodinae TaxID=1202767 RepID=A0A8T4GUR8_9EURY|nr:transcription initiation factor TFIIB [Halolamina salifodinae]
MTQPKSRADGRQEHRQRTDDQFDDDEGETLDAEGIDEADLVRTDKGELVHEETGIIVEEETIDRGPEWRAFDHSERQSKSRVGSPVTQARHDKGLTTDIDWRDTDAAGRQLSAEKRSRMRRLRTWQERIRTQASGERNLQQALTEIDRMASATGVPKSVREVACVIYRQALDRDLIRGRAIEEMATAALMAACRQEAIPRSLDDLTKVARVERREIGRSYRYISEELSLSLKPVDPGQYIPRFASELDLENETQQKASEIVEETTELGLHAGKSPTGFAAAAVYLASLVCSDRRTQRDIADIADVTVVTIRNRYKEQMDALDLDVSF